MNWFLAPVLFFPFQLPTAPPATTTAIGVGLTPQVMAAAGLSASDAEAVLGAASQCTDAAPLQTARASEATLQDELAVLVNQLRRSPSDSELRTAYEAKRAALASARQDVATLQQAVMADLTESLAQGECENLALVQANIGRRVPAEFLRLNVDKSEWDSILSALFKERRATRYGEQLDQDSAQLLATVRAETCVIACDLSLETNFAAIQTEFAEHEE